MNGLAAVGFSIDAMLELPDSLDERREPAVTEPAGWAAAEIPLFLALERGEVA